MPRAIVWTREMDNLVRRSHIKAAAAQLGVSTASVTGRRRVLVAIGHAPRLGRGRPAGRGPGAGPRAILRLFGRGHSVAEIVRKRDVSKQAVYDVLSRYVYRPLRLRRWCCICLDAFRPKLVGKLTCSSACEKKRKAHRLKRSMSPGKGGRYTKTPCPRRPKP